MLKYFYFAPGRHVWANLARKLSDDGIANPRLYLGDNAHRERLQAEFPDCQIIDFRDPLYGFNLKEYDISASSLRYLCDDNMNEIKDICLKMMDRIDLYGQFRRVDREALFYKNSLWASDRFDKHSPDFLLFGEAPHSWPQYFMYRMARLRGTKTLILGQWGIAPALYLRESISSEANLRSPELKLESDDDIILKIASYFKEIDIHNFNVTQPDYMKLQDDMEKNNITRERSKMATSVKRSIKYFFQKSHQKNALSNEANYKSKTSNMDDGSITRLAMLSGSSASIIRKEADHLKHRRCSLLSERLKENTTNIVPNPYVYFPLHYEPERTTCPDGGEYHDQFKALLKLRSTLSPETHIVVKEHKSQINGVLKGDLGRSPIFYDAITRFENVHLLCTEWPSHELMKNSVLVATITGTAALEAALLERKSIIFGHAWFQGCPNIFSFKEEQSVYKALEASITSRKAVEDFIISRYRNTAVPGFQNPSGRSRFHRFEASEMFQKDELEGLVSLVKASLYRISDTPSNEGM